MLNRNLRDKAAQLLLLACFAANTFAGQTDLATAPLSTSSSSSVLPNLMFIMDDSGSMGWAHLPDDSRNAGSSVTFQFGFYGLRSSQCNEVYYNPNITYHPPVKADGTSYPDANFDDAPPDGFKPEHATTNNGIDLDSQFRAGVATSANAGITGDTSDSAAYYYAYTGTQTSAAQRNYHDSTTTFYKECASANNTSPGNTVFAKVTISGTEQRKNFANWYSYYRTRMLMMKTAVGRAFKPIDSRYRVGFMTINNSSSNGKYLDISTFDQTHKNLWYEKLYGSVPSGGTPLRIALSTAGRIYAGKVGTLYGNAVADPVQYSCQQNFTILSTDGYWNNSEGVRLNGSTLIGNQDAGAPRPYTDGGTATFNVTTSQIKQEQKQLVEETRQILRRQEYKQQRTTQLQKKITYTKRREFIHQRQTYTSTNATVNIIIDDANSNAEVSVIRFGVTNILSSTAYGTGSSDGARMTSLVSNIASRLTNGYTAVSYGTCTSSNTPVSGCGSGDRYIVIMAPPGSGTVENGKSITITDSSVDWHVPANSSGGSNSSATSAWQDVGSCTASVTYSGNTRTETRCQIKPGTDTGFVNFSPSPCLENSSGIPNFQCQVTSDGWKNASACTESEANGEKVECGTAAGSWQTVASCTEGDLGNGISSECRDVDTQFQPAQSCTAGAVSNVTTTCNLIAPGPAPVASCTNQTATASNQWIQRICTDKTTSPSAPVESCSEVPASSSNSYVRTICTTATNGPTEVGVCTASNPTAGNNWTTTTCAVKNSGGGVADTLADVAYYYYVTDLRTDGAGNCTNGSNSDVCENNVPESGSRDTASWQHMTTFTLGLGARGQMLFSPTYLSDISGDFFDIKNGNKATTTTCTWQTAGTVCNWPIPGITNSGSDGKIENIDDLWHAAINGRGTFFSATSPTTLATGLSSALAGVTVRSGGTAAATTSTPNIVSSDNFLFGSNYTSGQWTGEFFRLTLDPVTLAFGTTTDWRARGKLNKKDYTTRKIFTFNPSDGTTKLKEFNWDNLTTSEKAYFGTAHISGADALTQLCTGDTNCLATWQANHSYVVGNEYRNGNTWYKVTANYTSGAAFGATDVASTEMIVGAADANLVNFIRGHRGHEGPESESGKYFRQRAHVLGDIVNSEAVYVKSPRYKYMDDGYAQYKIDKADRIGVVYVGANDGMLHAFRAGGTTITTGDGSGEEMWAYIPSMVMPNLFKLADKSYSSKHRYYVDGSPSFGDVYFDGTWHTILVGGLGGGGRGYYALDVTDPGNPKALWEFTYDTSKSGYTADANLGYTYGRPVITKLRDGKWVVLVTSGYNNGNGTVPGNGKGYLYVLDAGTGAIIGNPVPTNVGSTGTPSGLGQISQWANNPSLNNMAERVYGADLLGNVWRFNVDIDKLDDSDNVAHKLITVKGPTSGTHPSGSPQPIITKPILADVTGNSMVYVSTGKLLGISDLEDNTVQSFYAIKDPLDSTTHDNPRDADSGFVRQTLTPLVCPVGAPATTCKIGEPIRTGTSNSVDLGSSHNGWFLDFPGPGERANVDPALALGTIAINTNVPESNSCNAGGYSFSYYLNYMNGSPLRGSVEGSTQGVSGSKLGNGFASRPVIIESETGKVITISQVEGAPSLPTDGNGDDGGDGSGTTDPDADPDEQDPVTPPTPDDVPIGTGAAGVKRISWRELLD